MSFSAALRRAVCITYVGELNLKVDDVSDVLVRVPGAEKPSCLRHRFSVKAHRLSTSVIRLVEVVLAPQHGRTAEYLRTTTERHIQSVKSA